MDNRKFFSRTGLSYFIFGGLSVGIEFAIAIIVKFLAPDLLQNNLFLWAVSLGPMYLICAPLCAKLMKRIPAKRLYQNTMTFRKWLMFLSISIFLMYFGSIIGSVVSTAITSVTGGSGDFASEQMMDQSSLFITLLLVVIVGPLIEELLYRKILIDRIIVFGDKTAILISAFMFAILHGNFYQFFYAFAIGCVLAYVYIRTGLMRYNIGLHMAINFIGGFLPTVFTRYIDFSQLKTDASNVMVSNAFAYYVLTHAAALILFILFAIAMIVFVIAGIVFLIRSRKHIVLYVGERTMPAGRTANYAFLNVGMLLYIAVCAFLFVLNLR